MPRKLDERFIVFYAVVSVNGEEFDVNEWIKEIQEGRYREDVAWRGDIVIAKYCDNPFTTIIDMSIADYPLIKNFLRTHGQPQ